MSAKRQFALLGRQPRGKEKTQALFEKLRLGQELHATDPANNPNPVRFEHVDANSLEKHHYRKAEANVAPRDRVRNPRVTNLCYAIITHVKLNGKQRVKTTTFRSKKEELSTQQNNYHVLVVFR